MIRGGGGGVGVYAEVGVAGVGEVGEEMRVGVLRRVGGLGEVRCPNGTLM